MMFLGLLMKYWVKLRAKVLASSPMKGPPGPKRGPPLASEPSCCPNCNSKKDQFRTEVHDYGTGMLYVDDVMSQNELTTGMYHST